MTELDLIEATNRWIQRECDRLAAQPRNQKRYKRIMELKRRTAFQRREFEKIING